MARINEEWIVETEGALAAVVKDKLGLSVRQAKGLLDAGLIKVDGVVASKHGQRVKAGSALHANFDPQLKYDLKPRPGIAALDPYEVLYEDTHLLFVNKPAGLLTVPTEGGKEATLADAITDHYQRRGFKRFQLFIVHRIDRWTSGVLVFAKTPEALTGLKKMFELHKMNRVYKAILVGEIPENSGTLKGHLIEQAKTLRMRVVDPKKAKNAEGAQSAITHYRVLERLPGHTVVEVKLETGRRNQIRVQFADRGFPLLGDQVYGEVSELLDRQALHAEMLGLKHPVTEETITVTAPLPKDLDKALRALRNLARVSRAAEGKKGEEGLFKPKETRENKDKRVARAKRYEPAEARSGERPKGPRKDFGDRPSRPRIEGDRPQRPRADRDERPARGPRKDFGDRPSRPRTEGDERPARGPRRDFGDRPSRPRTDGDRPQRPRADRDERPARGPRKDFGDRPSRPRTDDDRPRRPRTEGEARPARGPRKEFGSRPAGARPSGPRSSSAPRGKAGAKPAGPRKPKKA